MTDGIISEASEKTGIFLSALDTSLSSNVEVAGSDILMQIGLFYYFVVPLLLLSASNFSRNTKQWTPEFIMAPAYTKSLA
jgi:hypothetical protein